MHRLAVLFILVALTAGCAATEEDATEKQNREKQEQLSSAFSEEDSSDVIKAFLAASAYFVFKDSSAKPVKNLSRHVARLAAQRGWDSGARTLLRETRAMEEILDRGGRFDSAWTLNLADVHKMIRLPAPVAEALEAVLSAGRSTDGSTEATAALREFNDALESYLDDQPDAEERLEAVVDLGHWIQDNPELLLKDAQLAPLVELFRIEQTDIVRAAAMRTLARAGSSLAEPLAFKALEDKAVVVRCAAIGILADFKSDRSRKPVTEILSRGGEPVAVRRACAKALRVLGDFSSVAVLINALNDMEEDSVRVQSLIALEVITNQNFGLRQSLWVKWWKEYRPKENS